MGVPDWFAALVWLCVGAAYALHGWGFFNFKERRQKAALKALEEDRIARALAVEIPRRREWEKWIQKDKETTYVSGITEWKFCDEVIRELESDNSFSSNFIDAAREQTAQFFKDEPQRIDGDENSFYHAEINGAFKIGEQDKFDNGILYIQSKIQLISTFRWKLFVTSLSGAYALIHKNLPPHDMRGELVPVYQALDNWKDVLSNVTRHIWKPEHNETRMFVKARGIYLDGTKRAQRDLGAPKPVWVSEAVHKASLEQVMDWYFKDKSSPFSILLRAKVLVLKKQKEEEMILSIPEEKRLEHTYILAGSGWGKTQTLQHFMLEDINRGRGFVVIDSQGDMISKLFRLPALLGKVILIDPRDIDYTPQLNMFDIDLERIKRYGAADREQILNGVIELYEYFFGSLLGAELTSKQGVVFRYLARLMVNIPGANILTLIDLCDNTEQYAHVIASLNFATRTFFEKEWNTKGAAGYNDTKQQIKRRLYTVIENDTFSRMFSAKKNAVNVADAMAQGKVILVDAAKDFLKGNASILGRFFIAKTLQAALERAVIPEHERVPYFLYVDEASDFFDSNIEVLLSQARKYKVGLTLAHQHLGQLPASMYSAIAANTSVKLVGGVSDRDARAMSSDMRCTHDFILSQRKTPESTSWAAYVRNAPSAGVYTVPYGSLENRAMLVPSVVQEAKETNRRLVSPPEPKPVAPALKEKPKPPPDDDDYYTKPR